MSIVGGYLRAALFNGRARGRSLRKGNVGNSVQGRRPQNGGRRASFICVERRERGRAYDAGVKSERAAGSPGF